jgi:hypothetical protein
MIFFQVLCSRKQAHRLGADDDGRRPLVIAADGSHDDILKTHGKVRVGYRVKTH